jgi:hypothetical protein
VREEEEERGGGPGDLFGIFEDFRDLSIKERFPTDLEV